MGSRLATRDHEWRPEAFRTLEATAPTVQTPGTLHVSRGKRRCPPSSAFGAFGSRRPGTRDRSRSARCTQAPPCSATHQRCPWTSDRRTLPVDSPRNGPTGQLRRGYVRSLRTGTPLWADTPRIGVFPPGTVRASPSILRLRLAPRPPSRPGCQPPVLSPGRKPEFDSEPPATAPPRATPSAPRPG